MRDTHAVIEHCVVLRWLVEPDRKVTNPPVSCEFDL